MRENPKVVSFERNAAYLHHRAMMNRRENHIVDALELMRQAVEQSPDNSEYKLDLAELYCEMGCHEQSARLLLDMLSKPDAPSECYYGLALNQLGMNDVSGAKQSLDLYRRRDPKGAHLEDVSQLAVELELYQSMNRPASRRLYRAMRVANRACDAMKADLPEKACRLFEASLKLASEQYEMRALYAMALLMAGRGDRALEEARKASEAYPPSVRALCVCAQVYALLDRRAEAEALMDRAAAERPSGAELRLMIYAAGEMKLNDRAAECARLALQETPFDRELLHIRGVALKRMGASDQEAGRCWERILRLDPDDEIALYYSELAGKGQLDAVQLEYAYQVPEAEFRDRMDRLYAELNEGLEHTRERWESDPSFRRLVRWAAGADDASLGRVSMTVLATVDSGEATSVLRELMFTPDVPRELKLHAAVLMKLQGRPLKEILPGVTEGLGDVLVDAEAVLAGLPVGDRQLVRYAGEVLEREYGVSALPALAMIWSAYRANRGTRGDPLQRIEAAAGAAAYYFLLSGGQRPEIGRLARAFGCSPRQLVYCAERIAACYDRRRGE